MANAYKLTREIISRVQELTAIGVPIEIMAPALGVSDVSIYNWKKRGERISKKKSQPRKDHDKLCVELFRARKKGINQFIANNLLHINRAAPKNWQASAWLLERRFPEHFGRIERQPNDSLNITTKVVLKSIKDASDEELRHKYDAYKQQNFA